MGDARKGQEFVTSLGDSFVIDSSKLVRPRTRTTPIVATAAVVFALVSGVAVYKWNLSSKAQDAPHVTISEPTPSISN